MKVWVFGDSFTDGSYGGNTGDKSWIDIIFERNGYEVENLSKSGQSNEGIYLSVIDTLPEISSDDTVIVAWSSNLRFLNIDDRDNFTRYIYSSRRHYNIWDPDSNVDVGTIDTLNPPLTNNLKMSICTSGLSAILREKNIKYKYIMGHMEFQGEVLDYTRDRLPHTEYREFNEGETSYFSKGDYIKFPHGYCLVNEFVVFQIDNSTVDYNHIIKTSLHKWGDIDYSMYSKRVFDYLKKHNELLLYDTWHLSQQGHIAFANYLERNINII